MLCHNKPKELLNLTIFMINMRNPNKPVFYIITHLGCCSVIKNAESPIDQIDWIYEFTTTKKKAFYEKLAENTRLTFYLRIGGWLAMVQYFGIKVCWVVHVFLTDFIFNILCSVTWKFSSLSDFIYIWCSGK